MARKPKSKTSLQRDLREADSLAGVQAQRITGLMSAISLQRSKYVGMVRQVFTREIEIARLNGYIDRVRETEGKSPEVTTRAMSHPPDQFDLAAMRDRLANAPQEDFDRMLDQMDDDTLERITGRDDDTDYNRG